MSFTTRASSQALVLASLLLVGCANDGTTNLFTTGALGTSETAAAEAKVDPACVSLVSRIEGLRKEGVADKIEKAAAKKYKMTNADLGNRINQMASELGISPNSIRIVPDPDNASQGVCWHSSAAGRFPKIIKNLKKRMNYETAFKAGGSGI